MRLLFELLTLSLTRCHITEPFRERPKLEHSMHTQVFAHRLRQGFHQIVSWLVLGLSILTISVPARPSQAQEMDPASNRKALLRVAPSYPQIAKTMKLSGKVRIVAKVAPSGKVISAEVVGGHPVLARAAADAVMQWRYEPAREETQEMAVISFQP